MYQTVPFHIDPVTSYINLYCPILTQHHQVPTSTAFYWPSTIMYQPVPLHTDPVPPKKFYPLKIFAQKIFTPKIFTPKNFHPNFFSNIILKYSIVRVSFVDLRWAQLYISLVSFIFPQNFFPSPTTFFSSIAKFRRLHHQILLVDFFYKMPRAFLERLVLVWGLPSLMNFWIYCKLMKPIHL